MDSSDPAFDEARAKASALIMAAVREAEETTGRVLTFDFMWNKVESIASEQPEWARRGVSIGWRPTKAEQEASIRETDPKEDIAMYTQECERLDRRFRAFRQLIDELRAQERK
jgi:hypothetical protein